MFKRISNHLLTAVLLAIAPSAALAQIDGAGADRLEVQIRGVENKAAFKGSDPISVSFTLRNPTDQKVQVLVWRTPFAKEGLTENIFVVAGGRTNAGSSQIGYIGPIIKRRPPGPEDYISLEPGESRTASVNLADYYAIYQQGDYSVSYRATNAPPIAGSSASPAQTTAGPLKKMAASSNAFTFSVTEARAPSPKATVAAAATQGLSFDQCDAGEQQKLQAAVPEAQKIAAAAAVILKATAAANQPNAARYKTWFGAYSPARYSTVTNHYEQIETSYRTKSIEIACKGNQCSSNIYAYVFPTAPYKIYVCGAFWAANLSGTDSRAGTLVHEMSHFDVVAGTNDIVYGQNGAGQLATQDPDSAITNADSHEYFAENNPNLPM